VKLAFQKRLRYTLIEVGVRDYGDRCGKQNYYKTVKINQNLATKHMEVH